MTSGASDGQVVEALSFKPWKTINNNVLKLIGANYTEESRFVA